MWNRINLKNRIFLILSALVFITMGSSCVMMWYTYRMEGILTSIISKDLPAFKTAEALETALVNQKGFVSYYFLDGDPDWLRQLGEYRQIFRQHLKDAISSAETEPEKAAIDLIENEYAVYIHLKDQVIDYYKNGINEAGSALHPKSRDAFFKILSLCQQYKNIHKEKILMAGQESKSRAKKSRAIAVVAMLVGFSLAVLLAFILLNQILGPVRELTMEAERDTVPHPKENEIKALSRSVRDLIKDADETHSELKKSRKHLLQAEKLALVGKLAAGMAHSIRNPFTSVKMRLFSLNRSLELSGSQKEDFEVITDEIRHIDTIVQNFLEFSRPPKLQMQQMSPSTIVDAAIQLLEHRVKSYDVAIRVNRREPLTEIEADPEQLKEVFVNLVVNACESMTNGGSIVIDEEERKRPAAKPQAIIRITDDGPGVPESVQDKILQPFFTTKEEGTGLGLSIAARIIEEHNGEMDLISEEGKGTTFIITLPVKEKNVEQDFNHR
jgi:signal transduction histidine kinase